MFNDLSNCSFEDVALIVNTAGKTKEQPVFANSVRWIQHPRDERRIFVDPVNDIRPTTSFPELPSRSSRDYHVRTKCDVKYLERSKVHKELAQRALPLDKQLTFKRISSNFFSPRSKTLILRSTRNIDEKREIYERTLLPVHVSLFLSSSFFFFFSFFLLRQTRIHEAYALSLTTQVFQSISAVFSLFDELRLNLIISVRALFQQRNRAFSSSTSLAISKARQFQSRFLTVLKFTVPSKRFSFYRIRRLAANRNVAQSTCRSWAGAHGVHDDGARAQLVYFLTFVSPDFDPNSNVSRSLTPVDSIFAAERNAFGTDAVRISQHGEVVFVARWIWRSAVHGNAFALRRRARLVKTAILFCWSSHSDESTLSNTDQRVRWKNEFRTRQTTLGLARARSKKPAVTDGRRFFFSSFVALWITRVTRKSHVMPPARV